MDGRPTWTDCDKAGDYVVPNVLSPMDLVSRPDKMDKTVPHTAVKVYLQLHWIYHHLSLFVRKPVFEVFDQVRHKPGCTATEDG